MQLSLFPTPSDDSDTIPAAVPTRCKSGQMWQLGRHKLYVADCTVTANVARLMDGAQANIVITSPPYWDQRTYGLEAFDWHALMRGMMDGITPHMVSNGNILVNLGMVHRGRRVLRYWDAWLDYCEAIGWPCFGWYVWDLGFGMPGNNDGRLKASHEFIFHFNKDTYEAHKWVATLPASRSHTDTQTFRQKDGSTKKPNSPDKIGQNYKVPDSVIRIGREQRRDSITENHPAVFPVAFPEFLLKTWSQPDDICYEPFCGSGTTIIACERLKRVCYATDVNAQYCDVALYRWERFTGQKACLLA